MNVDSRPRGPEGRRLLLLATFFVAWSALIAGCGRPPEIEAKVLVAYSRSGTEVRRIALPSGKEEGTIGIPGIPGDLSRGRGGETYIAAGPEILVLPPGGEPLPLLRIGGSIDTVLPSSDGGRLYILEHPAGGEPHGGAHRSSPLMGEEGSGVGAGGPGSDSGPEAPDAREPRERRGPHRLRIWDLRGSRFSGEVELDPLAYEIVEGPGVVLATHLKGRRIEAARLRDGGFAGPASEVRLPPPPGGDENRQAMVRAAAVEPGGRWAILVESGIGGEWDRSALWTLDLDGLRPSFHPLAARGVYQDSAIFLGRTPDGGLRIALNARDRLLIIEGGTEGFREGKPLPLPGLFFDPRIAGGARAGAESSSRELVLLAGCDTSRKRGLIAAVDPAGPRVAWVWRIPAPADLLEVEG
jgi:hypothetical protein